MRAVVRGAAALALTMFVVSCSGLLKKKGEDAGVEASLVTTEVAEDAAAAPAPPPAALALNEGDITRFPDETKLPDTRAILLRPYNVREAVPAGPIVAALPKGTEVTQIAQRETSYLVVFDDPKSPGRPLMGWISRDAFNAVVHDAGPVVCPKGEVLVLGDSPFCGKVCGDDRACPAGQACRGQANKLLPNGKGGDVLTVCTVYQAHDAGAAPSVVDAGKPVDAGKVVDAGGAVDAGKPADAGHVDAGKAPTPVVDAGPAPAPTPPTPSGPAADVVAPTGGKCPAGFLLVTKTAKCHRSCASGATQPERLKNCRNKNPLCIKCDRDEKKVCADTQDQCR